VHGCIFKTLMYFQYEKPHFSGESHIILARACLHSYCPKITDRIIYFVDYTTTADT
jgi:hypothetical protein